MKKITYLLVLFFLATKIQAQSPQTMSYQAVVRNSSNALLINTTVGMKISILQGSATGTPVYTETQTATTNANGLVSIQIGKGNAGTFAAINWANGPYFIQTETDPTGGSYYTITGTQQMMSVPYALYAAKSGDATSLGPIGPSSNTNGATITSGVLSLAPADETNGGVVTTGAQTFAGNKTFTGTTTANGFVKTGGTSTQYLMADGSTSAGIATTTMGTIGASSNANGATITSGVLSLAPADASNGGIVTTGPQTFGGNKTFTSNLYATQNFIAGNPGWTTDGKFQSWNTNYNGKVLEIVGTNANYTGAAASFWNSGIGPSIDVDYAGTGQKIMAFKYFGNEVASIKKNGELNASSFVKIGGTASQYLMADGSTSAGTATTTMGAIGASTTANGATITAGVLSLTPADATNGGVVTTGTQTFAGNKAFSGNVTTAGTMGVGTTTPVASAKLEVTSTNQGFLPPRMTYTQRNSIATPATGLVLFCTDCGPVNIGGELQIYSGGIWRNIIGLAAMTPVPTVSATTAATNITLFAATSGGAVTSDGGSPIIARGVCWSTSQNPTIANSKTSDAGTTGTFTSSLSGLSANTTYYVRTYATNASGTVYGTQISFTTLSSLPIIASTTLPYGITNTAGTSGGTITSDGGLTITARGVCWSTSQNPTTALATKTTDGTGSGTFSSSISGLNANTLYYVRSYATNGLGTTYGAQVILSTTATAAALAVGQSYGGGIVAYIFQNSDPGYVAGQVHGLIAASLDQNIAVALLSKPSTNFTSPNLGTGLANTNALIANQGNTGSYAAKICRDYNGGNYTDWYLPSKDELNKLYLNRGTIGGFNGSAYWSSTQLFFGYFIADQWFNNDPYSSSGGTQADLNGEVNAISVRAIRTF